MYKTITKNEFIETFKQNETRKNQFTREGLESLYDYLELLELETGEDLEFDMVAICCDFTEYHSLKELQEEYPEITDFEDLNEKTIVIPVDNRMEEQFIIQNY